MPVYKRLRDHKEKMKGRHGIRELGNTRRWVIRRKRNKSLTLASYIQKNKSNQNKTKQNKYRTPSVDRHALWSWHLGLKRDWFVLFVLSFV